jgi:hypothetical protein
MYLRMKPISLLAAIFAISLVGCSKKEAATDIQPAAAEAPTEAAAPVEAKAAPKANAPAPAQEVLPGAAGVRRDLQNKNYTGAVEGLVALKALASAAGSDAWQEYRQLNMDVGVALNNAARTDSSAAQALNVYRLSQAR